MSDRIEDLLAEPVAKAIGYLDRDPRPAGSEGLPDLLFVPAGVLRRLPAALEEVRQLREVYDAACAVVDIGGQPQQWALEAATRRARAVLARPRSAAEPVLVPMLVEDDGE